MRIRDLRWALWPCLGLSLAVACGDDDSGSSSSNDEAPSEPQAPRGPLLEESGSLTNEDTSDGRGRFDRYFVEVAAGERIVVELTSSAFDPILEVTPPDSGALVNDDYEGDITRSRIELISRAAGQMKIEVRAYSDRGEGAYSIGARRVDGEDQETPNLSIGQEVAGEIQATDHELSGGQRFDSYVIVLDRPAQIAVRRRGAAPTTTLVGPGGLTLQASNGGYDAPNPGTYRLQVMGEPGMRYTVTVRDSTSDQAPLLTRAHHQFNELLRRLTGGGSADPGPRNPTTQPGNDTPTAPTDAHALPVRIGDRLNGELSTTDARLPSGEYFDVYELTARDEDRGAVAVELESSAFDCFLRVEGPGGELWENDDYGGTTSSRVEIELARSGTYRIVTTSYRAGEAGAYELKVLTQRDTEATGAPPEGAPQHEQTGDLAQGDSTLESGEFYDEYTFEWPVGTRIRLEARSTEIDPYLIVRPPTGPQRDNDDMNPGQSLDAGLDLQVSEAGPWRVLVTSYRPGEVGHYTLTVRGSDVEGGASTPEPGVTPTPVPTPTPTPTPTPAPTPAGGTTRTETGNLAQGDRTLQSGEFSDVYPMRFTAGSAVSIRLTSTQFDTYLIVRSPSGEQTDNDDLTPGAGLDSGVDIPAAEPGDYRVTVTSYRPGETGRYTLSITEGASVVGPPPGPNGAGGRVWGLFAGITDYPGSTNDLPECANDARKLAEAIRNQGNMPSDQEFLLTDSQATLSGIRQAMTAVAARIRPDDVFVFFYSGHGGQTNESHDPRELDSRDEYLYVYDGELMDDELGRLFDQIHARVALVAIDACFAGGFSKDVITQPGRVGMFSSEEDVTSAVAGRFQAGGYLSHFLRVGIQGEADNDPRNAILTVGELTHYTWRQFGQHASDVRMSMGYQHLVVDRGAVHTSEVLWGVRR
ncbi:MAG: pre-peptidase C-terminal domain-containing protein [Sandaracinaceae bacterium]